MLAFILAMPFLLMSAFRGLVDAVHAQLESAGFPGIRASHGFAMQAIGAGCTSVELGHRLGVTKQAATRTARALEGWGLVRRVPNEHDRRKLVLTPTRRGQRMLRLSAEAFRNELRSWRQRVGDERVDATLATLAGASAGHRGPTDLSDWV
ncbi:MAG: MarR family winged helix-turn-helix transcriptional regulator [Propionibacteriaceae bacterium]